MATVKVIGPTRDVVGAKVPTYIGDWRQIDHDPVVIGPVITYIFNPDIIAVIGHLRQILVDQEIDTFDFDIEGERVVIQKEDGTTQLTSMEDNNLKLICMIRVARIVKKLHENGIVIRTISPTTIWVRADGTPVFTDYSLVFVRNDLQPLSLVDFFKKSSHYDKSNNYPYPSAVHTAIFGKLKGPGFIPGPLKNTYTSTEERDEYNVHVGVDKIFKSRLKIFNVYMRYDLFCVALTTCMLSSAGPVYVDSIIDETTDTITNWVNRTTTIEPLKPFLRGLYMFGMEEEEVIADALIETLLHIGGDLLYPEQIELPFETEYPMFVQGATWMKNMLLSFETHDPLVIAVKRKLTERADALLRKMETTGAAAMDVGDYEWDDALGGFVDRVTRLPLYPR